MLRLSVKAARPSLGPSAYVLFKRATFLWNILPGLPETRLILHFPGVGHLYIQTPRHLFIRATTRVRVT